MNDTFNIKRFCLLLQKDIQESWKKYMMRVLTIFGVLAIFLTWDSYMALGQAVENGRIPEYLNRELLTFVSLFFFIFGCISASLSMEPINSKTKRLSYLMNPSSSFEKFFSRWLIFTIGYIVAYVVLFFMADAVRVLICSVMFPSLDVAFIDLNKLIGDKDYNHVFNDSLKFAQLVCVFFFFQSLFILGSTFWPKNAFIKSFSAGTIVFIAFLFICWITISIVFKDGMEGFGNALNNGSFRGNSGDKEKGVMYIFAFFALVNWIIAFFRFKESEVIKRW
ncbi:hypothetical protein [Prevotella sp. 10(H)]|uniref:hypothetical protein n=1 Tax=Prevotella sp. 10(H) TaxID=1158294 RepID=UPI0004A721DF|nr:hypothetical protein [Prevotella sp. 10(H)]